MNYLFTIHSLASAGTSGDLKVSCDEKSVRGSAATLRPPISDPSTAITLSGQNIDQAVQQRLKLQTTIEEWNTFFFLPRGLLVVAKIEMPAPSKSTLDQLARHLLYQQRSLRSCKTRQRIYSPHPHPSRRRPQQQTLRWRTTIYVAAKKGSGPY
jgi:hypothetical protein